MNCAENKKIEDSLQSVKPKKKAQGIQSFVF